MIGKSHSIHKDERVTTLDELYPKSPDLYFEKLYYIDGQILNSPDFNRGIGRYTLLFAINLAKRNPDSSFRIFLTNQQFPNRISDVLDVIKSNRLQNLQIQIFDIFQEKNETSLISATRELSKQLELVRPKAVIIPSFFNDETQVIPFTVPKSAKSIGILHDLIPLQFQKYYLPTKTLKKKYMAQLQRLMSSDVILSVSKTSLDAFESRVTYSKEKAVIGGASTLEFGLPKSSFDERAGILCVGGSGKSKNMYRLVYGHSKIPRTLKRQHPLKIVGIINSKDRIQLRMLSLCVGANAKILGYISTEELQNCFLGSRILVVPSLAEGLSLPVYEMWTHGGIAIGGIDTALEETIGDVNMLFNPVNFHGYVELVSKLLLNKHLWEEEQKRASEVMKKRNWEHVACITEKYL
jgi:glycosyltransferase involved in cell wall biosynthesis